MNITFGSVMYDRRKLIVYYKYESRTDIPRVCGSELRSFNQDSHGDFTLVISHM